MNLARLRLNHFLVIGRAGMDLYADPPGTRMEVAKQFTAALGGSAANIAVAIARMGGAAALLTAVSDDAVGRYVVSELQSYGVATQHCYAVGGEARNSLAVVETRSENCQSVIYRNGAADFQLTSGQVEPIDLSTYGGLIVTGTALALEPSRTATLLAMTIAKAQGLPVILDIDYRPYSWSSRGDAATVGLAAADLSDVVIGNDEEFDLLAGVGGDGLALAAQMAERSAAIVIHKMGAQGSITFSGASRFKTGVYSVTALKPTGAGDAFLGTFLASLATRHKLADCVRRGSAAAALVVTRVGCAPAMPTSDALATFMTEHSGPG